jgi:hypothetical protein
MIHHPPESVLSTVRREWCEKDLCEELGGCHPRTVKRWWRKLKCPPDKRHGGPGAMNLWTQLGAEHFVRSWRTWWAMRGHNPDIQTKKFSSKLPKVDTCQLELNFHDSPKQKNSQAKTGRKIKTARKVAKVSRRGKSPRHRQRRNRRG